MMKISKDLYMGKGCVKVVYRHPTDPDICIKFADTKKKRALHDIRREISYLKKHQDYLPWLAPYLGEVHCDIGIGYMYQIVRNEDGSPSENIQKLGIEKHKEAIKEKLSAMYSDLLDRHAVVNDLNKGNFFARFNKEGDFDLILIDGFGNNNFIKIADYSKFFLRKKLNRKFKKLCTRSGIPSDFIRE